ncbi:MAG: flavin reductase domain protein FMN-binding [Herminiimonas sp.]|nr:flavin reductase domain protein FMN-binding [Herminiimonas sp.]
MADLPQKFRQAMRHLAASVCVVTARDGQRRMGITATAVTSLSMEPPALLVCIHRASSLHAVLRTGFPFCINILSAEQHEVADTFGGRAKLGEERFTVGQWRDGHDSVPYLSDAEASVFCHVDHLVDYATHTIVVGRIQLVNVADRVEPLLYANGAYRGLTTPLTQAGAAGRST